LPGPAKLISCRICAGIKRNLQFAPRSDVDAIDHPGHDTDSAGIGLAFIAKCSLTVGG
jgi:hypothetical protein